ncbi:MAG: hypothetical protein PWQ20_1141 [Thermotogaceae bacterium]|jgi:hypothetical protein|nr:hypothetical protein [Thermotogaceae bacterium]
MKKRVLLVNPWIYDFAAYDYWLKPVGLLYIASLLNKLGIEVVLLDLLDRHSKELKTFLRSDTKDRFFGTGKFYFEEIEKPELLKEIPRIYKRYGFPLRLTEKILEKFSAERFDAIFITSTLTYWYPGVWDTVKLLKSYFPSIPVVLGGIYTSLFPNHAEQSGADYVLKSTSMEVAQRTIERVLKIDIPESLKKNWFQELQPMYELYDELKYAVLLTSLGCPFRCSYCASWKLQPDFKTNDPVETVKYIEELALKGIMDIVFFDDAILVAKEKFKELLKLIISKGLNTLRYHLPNGLHVRLIDEETARLLKIANFKTVILAVETLDPVLQRKTSNKLISEDFYKAVSILKKEGFSNELKVYLLINIPGQNEEDIINSINVCHELGLRIYLNEYTPIPFTRDWDYLLRAGIVSEKIDPLLLNNKVLPYWSNIGLNATTVEKLKAYVRDLNLKLKEKEVIS